MKCPNCQADLPNNAETCPWCGSGVTPPEDAAQKLNPRPGPAPYRPEEAAPYPYRQPEPISPAPVSPPPQIYQPQPQPKRGISPVIWIIGGILLAVVICCVLLFLLGILSA